MRTDRELTALFTGALIEERPDPTFLDELFQALVEEVATLGPAAARRPLPVTWWSRAARWPLAIAAGLVIATLAFAVLLRAPNVGPLPSPTPAPTPTATPAPIVTVPPAPTPVPPSSTLVSFTSSTYGYSISYPSNWGTRPATTVLDRTIYPTDGNTSVDYFAANAPAIGDPGLIIAGPTVPAGTTVTAWVASIQQLQASTVGCPPAQATEPVTIGGEQGQLLTWAACPAWLLWAGVVHGDRAYHVIWIDQFATNDPALQASDKALFLRILGSVTFGG